MSRTAKYLLEQIERAKRFAAALSDPADRERFEKVAANYQSELDAARASSPKVESTFPPEAALSATIAATSEVGSSDAVSSEPDSAPTSTGDQQETKE
jgi:ABC-type Zn uptake system ZnuABC Zn-binding protein ZnuA